MLYSRYTGDDKVEYLPCYNSTIRKWQNSIIDQYDYETSEQTVTIVTNNTDTFYSQDILWARDKNITIPRKIYCWAYTTCTSELLELDISI